MTIILFDDTRRINLLPLSYTRPCGDLRVGILTIAEKWKHYIKGPVSFLTEDHLSKKFSPVYSDDNLYINGRLLADSSISKKISELKSGEGLLYSKDNIFIAFRTHKTFKSIEEVNGDITFKNINSTYNIIDNVYDIFTKNDDEIKKDFNFITENRTSAIASSSNTLIGNNIFIEEGASIEGAIINSKNGPVYIGKNAEVMEGALIRGSFALCEGATVKMGAKIYGGTTVGPHCKVGGEISNVVFQARSNKGHDGFLGNSVIGEWCNLGAGTNGSNLKNNYAQVKLWNYESKRFTLIGLQFCGLIMGDHSKCGINTMFNTGTVVGVSANIFGAGFPRNLIPSFTWGGSSGFSTYSLGKSFDTASMVMARRKEELTEVDKAILKHIFEASSEYRLWENKALKA